MTDDEPDIPESLKNDVPSVELRDEDVGERPYNVWIGASRDGVIRHGMSVSEDELAALVSDALELLAENTDDERKANAAENARDMLMYGEVNLGDIHGATAFEVEDEGEAEIQITAGSSKVRARIPDDEIGDALARKVEQARDELEGYDAGDL